MRKFGGNIIKIYGQPTQGNEDWGMTDNMNIEDLEEVLWETKTHSLWAYSEWKIDNFLNFFLTSLFVQSIHYKGQ